MLRALVLVAMTASPTAIDRYVQAGHAAGCPRDQLTNFLRAGIVLQPQQLLFAAAARQCDQVDGPVEIGFGGARMGGKSHAMLSQVGADDCVRQPGLKALILRKVGISARESFEALLPKTIGSLGRYVPSEGVFRLRNGSWIRLGHFHREGDIDKYLGLEYDVIATEEATTLSSSKKDAIRSCCRSPIGSGWRARAYYSANPGGVGHAWFKRTFVEPYRNTAQTSTRFVPSTIDDNALATDEYRKFLDSLTGWLKRAWRYGDWDIAAGQFFTNFRRDLHVVPDAVVPGHWPIWMGFDYGFTHYTAAHVFTRDGDGNVYVVGEHAERRWLPQRHAAAIEGVVRRLGVEPARLHGIYAGGDVFAKKQNGGTIAGDYAKHGLTLKHANMDRINGAAEILTRLGDADSDPPIAPRLFISEACPRLLECLPSLEHDPHRPEDVLKVDCDEQGLGGDDVYDSFRYGLMADAKPKTRRARAGDARAVTKAVRA